MSCAQQSRPPHEIQIWSDARGWAVDLVHPFGDGATLLHAGLASRAEAEGVARVYARALGHVLAADIPRHDPVSDPQSVPLDPVLEAAIDEVGRDRVLSLMRELGWGPDDAPPKWVWERVVELLKLEPSDVRLADDPG